MSASAQKASSSTMTSRPAPVSPLPLLYWGGVCTGVECTDNAEISTFSAGLRGDCGEVSWGPVLSMAVNVNSYLIPVAAQRPPGISLGFGFTGVDYCLLSDHGCEYSCVNTDRSFACQCPEGHVLRSDGKTCASEFRHIEILGQTGLSTGPAGASGLLTCPECPLGLTGPLDVCVPASQSPWGLGPKLPPRAPGNGFGISTHSASLTTIMRKALILGMLLWFVHTEIYVQIWLPL